MVKDRAQIEKSKDDFSLPTLLVVRKKTLEAVQEISRQIEVGMYEEDAYEMAKSVLKEMGSDKSWHRPWIRFGPNTLKPYSVLSEPHVRLGPDDIFFIDIGPVWDGYEGDGGDTFVTGANEELRQCKDDVKRLFDLVKKQWKNEHWSGQKLYQYAVHKAKELGWELNLRANGHRLSDFPHAIYFKGGLADVNFEPLPHAWVLEIQIRHPAKNFGAFYEDLLF